LFYKTQGTLKSAPAIVVVTVVLTDKMTWLGKNQPTESGMSTKKNSMYVYIYMDVE
jgi:hypothetical protein